MEVDFTRDHAMYAVIFGIFSAVWFAIALEKPPKLWKKIIYAGIGTGLLLAIVGGVLMYFHHNAPSALGPDETWRLFGNTVIVEFVACSIGVGVLNWRKNQNTSPRGLRLWSRRTLYRSSLSSRTWRCTFWRGQALSPQSSHWFTVNASV